MLDKSVIQDEQALSGQTSRCATRGRVQEVAGTLSLDNSPRASVSVGGRAGLEKGTGNAGIAMLCQTASARHLGVRPAGDVCVP